MPGAEMKKVIVLDMHLHVVSIEGTLQLLKTLAERLRTYHESGALVGAVLYNRGQIDGWAAVAQEMATCGALITPGDVTMQIVVDGIPLWLFRGLQVVTAERVEVLAILPQEHISDGLPFAEVLARCEQAAAVAVLPWSPGKWLGARGSIVRAAITAQQVRFIGDIPIRWWGRWLSLPWSRTVTVLAGSDPLTFSGDEAVAGSLLTVLQPVQPFNEVAMDGMLLRKLLLDTATACHIQGSYGTLRSCMRRWVRAR